MYVFLQISWNQDSFGLFFLCNTHANETQKCSGGVGTPCPSLRPVTFHTSSLHSTIRCQMGRGRMRLWCTWVVCLFESNVLQPTCQNCSFTITFAEEDHFWHGCHTSTSGLLFKHGALLQSYISSRHPGLHKDGDRRFSVCLHSEAPAFKEKVLPSFGWGSWRKLCIPLAFHYSVQPRWKEEFQSYETWLTNKCAVEKTCSASTWGDTSAYQAVLRAYSTL